MSDVEDRITVLENQVRALTKSVTTLYEERAKKKEGVQAQTLNYL